MKTLLVSCALLIACTSFAKTQMGSLYLSEKTISAPYLGSQAECEEEKGSWDKEGEMCLLKVSDRVTLKPTQDSKAFELEITTISTNMHMCNIAGIAKLSNNGKILTLSQGAEEYDSESGKTLKVTCTVKAKLSKKGAFMSLTANDKCRSFCGANAWLESDHLKKVK